MGRFSKALVMHDFSLAQILDGVAHVGVVNKTKYIIISYARLLLCSEVLVKVCDNVALDTDILHIKRYTCRAYGVNAKRMVYEISVQSRALYFLRAKPFRELIKYCGYHLQVREFVCTSMMTLTETIERASAEEELLLLNHLVILLNKFISNNGHPQWMPVSRYLICGNGLVLVCDKAAYIAVFVAELEVGLLRHEFLINAEVVAFSLELSYLDSIVGSCAYAVAFCHA